MPRKIRIREHAKREDEPKVKANLKLHAESKKVDKNEVLKRMSDGFVRDIEDVLINGTEYTPVPATSPVPCCENCHYWEHYSAEHVPLGFCRREGPLEGYALAADQHCYFHEYELTPGHSGEIDFPVTANEGDLFVFEGRSYIRQNGAWVPVSVTQGSLQVIGGQQYVFVDGRWDVASKPLFSWFGAVQAAIDRRVAGTSPQLLWLWLIPVVSFTLAGVLWILGQ